MLDPGRWRAVLAVGLLIVAVAGAGTLDVRSSADAMACCAKTHGQCAGMKSADDCCVRMMHASPAVSAVLTAPHPVLPFIPTSHLVLPWSSIDRAATDRFADFKRPHDPPHLHAPALLI